MVTRKVGRKHGPVTTHRGKIHQYLGMEIDYTKKGKVIIGMKKYVLDMLENFPQKFKSTETARTPAGNGLFNLGQGGNYKRDAHTYTTLQWRKDYSYANEHNLTYSPQLLYYALGGKTQTNPIGRS